MRTNTILALLFLVAATACNRKDETSGVNRLIDGTEAAPAALKKPTVDGPIAYGFKGTTTDGRRVKGTLTVTPTVTHPEGAPEFVVSFPAEIELTMGNDLRVAGRSAFDQAIQGNTLSFIEFSVRVNEANGLLALYLKFDEPLTEAALEEQLTRLDEMSLVESGFLIESYDGPPIQVEGTLTLIKKGHAA
jgi:hypothetical protein